MAVRVVRRCRSAAGRTASVEAKIPRLMKQKCHSSAPLRGLAPAERSSATRIGLLFKASIIDSGTAPVWLGVERSAAVAFDVQLAQPSLPMCA